MKKQLEKHALDVEALIDRCSCASVVGCLPTCPISFALMPRGNMNHAVGSHSEGRAIAGSH